MARGSGGQIELSLKTILNLEIPLPEIDIQNQIVEEIDKERQLIKYNKSLIKLFENKIKLRIEQIYE